MSSLVTCTYEGSSFVFRDDGWFNATVAAKKFRKEPHEWLRMPETVRYLGALRRTYGQIPYVETSRARADRGGGTWLHPKLAVLFTRWINVDFAVWCDMQIDAIIRREVVIESNDGEMSSVGDRIPLLLAAVHALDRHGIALPSTYRAFNRAAGSARFRLMTVAQVRSVEPIARRIASRTDTQADWASLAIPESTQNRLAGF